MPILPMRKWSLEKVKYHPRSAGVDAGITATYSISAAIYVVNTGLTLELAGLSAKRKGQGP